MNTNERILNTPKCDWPVADCEQSGIGRLMAIYGGECIAATEFVIGATLAQYGCSAKDVLIGLLIGNLLASLLFRFFSGTMGVRTRLTLYTFLGKVVGIRVQKLYNVIFGIGFGTIAALGLGVSGTAIRWIINAPIQYEWYPTSFKFVLSVLCIGFVVVFVAANGFHAVSRFSVKCVPWLTSLFLLGFLCVIPQLTQATGFGPVTSLNDFYRLLSEQIWNGTVPAGSARLGIQHVILFAVVCNLAVHLGLNDMSMFRYAKTENDGYAPVFGLFVGHYMAWISAAIMGATAAAVTGTSLALLDSGEVTFAILGYTGLLGVIIAGWTTANPTIYRVALSFNNVFPQFTYKQMTYLSGAIVVILACFPGVQRAGTVINYCGLLVVGMGAICMTDYFIFPRIGYTRYWNLYKKNSCNWPALISWGLSLLTFAVLMITEPFHQNYWFIPVYLISGVAYLVLAGMSGAKEKYPEAEKEEEEYETELLRYVNKQVVMPQQAKKTRLIKGVDILRYLMIAGMFVVGFAYWIGDISTDIMKTGEWIETILYFVFKIIVFIIEEKLTLKALST